METMSPGPSKGYQKQVQKTETNAPKKSKPTVDYSSPTAKKWPLMLSALESGDLEAVKKYIEEGVNVNVLRAGVTPLMIAASKGHVDVAEAILQAGVNINERSDDGRTALHMAASDQPDTAIVDLLLQSGIDSDAKSKSGTTALNMAEDKGHRDIVRIIKKHQQQLQADAREWDEFLNTPEGNPYKQKRRYESLSSVFYLWWIPPLTLGLVGVLPGLFLGVAVIGAVIGTVCGLLVDLSLFLWQKKTRAYLDSIEPLPVLDIHILREKRKAGEPITIDKTSTATAGREETVDEAIEVSSSDIFPDDQAASASVDKRNDQEPPVVKKEIRKITPTMVIAAATILVVVALIGAAVIYRASLMHWYYAKKLERQDIQVTGQAFLVEVAQNHEDAVDLFIKAGIDIATVNEKGRTALHIASEKGHVNMLNKLVSLNPALLQKADKSGSTALMIAAREGREAVVTSLVANGAEVNYVTFSKEAATALQAAVAAPEFKEEQVRIVHYLLQKGADPKGKNKSGQFPLLFAADHGRADVAGLLIEKGADVNDVDGNGNFPVLSAACKGHSGFVSLLAEKGANLNLASPEGRTPLMCAVQGGHIDTIKTILEKGASVNAKTADGNTALTDATKMGDAAEAALLLAHGADPVYGYIPEGFTSLNGKPITVTARKEKLSDVLRRIGMAAAQDGYVVNFDYNLAQKITMKTKASWNKVLRELAAKNKLLLVIKDKEVSLLPYTPTSVKRKTT
jgi:ankyrin repeat protein